MVVIKNDRYFTKRKESLIKKYTNWALLLVSKIYSENTIIIKVKSKIHFKNNHINSLYLSKRFLKPIFIYIYNMFK